MQDFSINYRRLRANTHIRDLAAEVFLSHKEFIQPLFVDESLTERLASDVLTGVYSDTQESILTQIEADILRGVSKFLLFPVPTSRYTTDFQFDFATKTVARIKEKFGDTIWLACDLCLCSYTTHGHCGVLNTAETRILNTETCHILADYALELAKAGADCIAPSDMMDGRVGAIRQKLNKNGFDFVAIMSYSAKFASHFYGPFRDVCKSSPSKNENLRDRKTYQMDFRNGADALLSSLRDAAEGADILMVKPALPYLDILTKLKQQSALPIAVYHVSGEYAAIELMAKNGLIDADAAHLEVWTACKRAGASAIISYKARLAKQLIENN